jgi:hypothetical protein
MTGDLFSAPFLAPPGKARDMGGKEKLASDGFGMI